MMNKEIELKPCREAFEAWKTQSERWEYAAPLTAFNAGYQAAQAQLQAENERLRGALTDISDYAQRMREADKSLEGQIRFEKITIVAKAALQHNEAL
jgi:hypothetical protein